MIGYLSTILIIFATWAPNPAHAACTENPADERLAGEFKILSVDRAVLTCRVDEDGKDIKPQDVPVSGCLVTAKFKGAVRIAKDQQAPIKLYSGGKVCKSKVGDTVNLKVNVNCCDTVIKGYVTCEGTPPRVINADLNSPIEVTCLTGRSWIDSTNVP